MHSRIRTKSEIRGLKLSSLPLPTPRMSETKLPERQQKILNLTKESPTITGKQMSEILSVSQRTIERDLSALQKLSILKHEGKDNDGAVGDSRLNSHKLCITRVLYENNSISHR